MHDVMEVCWRPLPGTWYSALGIHPRGSGDAKTLLHGSTSELAQQFKVASDGARTLNWERLAI